MQTDVTVLGLGNVGTQLTRALVRAGLSVTVWNRTPARADALAPLGVQRAGSAAEAVASATIVLMTVTDYRAARELIDDVGAARLAGRLLLQWTGGTPEEARELGDGLTAQGVRVLDLLLLSYPSDLSGRAVVYLAGSPDDAESAADAILTRTAWAWSHVGEDLGRAKAMGHLFEPFIDHAVEGFLIGAAIAEHEGIGIQEYLSASRPVMEVIAQTLEGTTSLIGSGTYVSGQMTLTLWAAGLGRQIAHAESRGVDVTTLRHIKAQMDQRIADGFGDDDIAGLHAVIRGPGPRDQQDSTKNSLNEDL